MTGKGQNKHIFLPFLYFFSLSIGLIVLFSYFASGNYKHLNGIYAQEPVEAEFTVKTIKEEPSTELSKTKIPLNDNMAKKIDAYFAKRKAPLAGYGYIFTREARDNNIDPLIVAAIAQCESQGGKVTPQFGGVESYNAWGYAVFDKNSITKNMNAYGMGSFENGIALMSRAIRKYYDKGLIEPHEIVTRYTPASVRKANGNSYNAPWTLCVTSTMKKIENIDVDTH